MSMLNLYRVSDKTLTEPAINTGLTATGIASVIVMVLGVFFPNLVSEDVKQLIFGLAAIFFPFITSWLIRSKVWSPASVKVLVGEVVADAKSPQKPPFNE